jgi:hypothetical protein
VFSIYVDEVSDYTTDCPFIEVSKFGSQTFSHMQVARFGTIRSTPKNAIPLTCAEKSIDGKHWGEGEQALQTVANGHGSCSFSSIPMRLDSHQLADLMVTVIKRCYVDKSFRRRELMLLTEKEVMRLGLWTPADDPLSGSADPKSRGLANIDYRFSDLARWGRIVREHWNCWRLVDS